MSTSKGGGDEGHCEGRVFQFLLSTRSLLEVDARVGWGPGSSLSNFRQPRDASEADVSTTIGKDKHPRLRESRAACSFGVSVY